GPPWNTPTRLGGARPVAWALSWCCRSSASTRAHRLRGTIVPTPHRLDPQTCVSASRRVDVRADAGADPFLTKPTRPARHFQESARGRPAIGRGGRQTETHRR